MYKMENTSNSAEIMLAKKADSSLDENKKTTSTTYDMVVFCHLRWGFVYQRPQHIISGLSKKYSVLFVEEPIHFEAQEENTYELEEISSSLHVLKPKVKSIQEISALIKPLFKDSSPTIGWFYSPAFSVLIPDFSFGTIIYDCMDELSLFKGAAAELINQEKFLLENADLVFTGGKSLYESKVKLHKNVVCFPSSVDRKHFQQALEDIPVPEDLENIPAPIVGYFGVIDERIDLDLLKNTAKMHQNISFVMIGPLAKIEENELPVLSNIYYLGMKSYENLPNYLKGFDIAMMPFALNEATKFISPTKTLEYMAAGKPIISTAIKDVVRDYENCVHIIESANDFSAEICKILYKKENNVNEYEPILEQTSWSNTVAKIDELIKQQIK